MSQGIHAGLFLTDTPTQLLHEASLCIHVPSDVSNAHYVT